MQHYVLKLYSYFYIRVLENYYEKLNEFDRGSLTYFSKNNGNEFAKTFLSDESVNLLYGEIRITSEDFSYPETEIELEFLEHVAIRFFQNNNMTSEQVKSLLQASILYQNLLYTNTQATASKMIEFYEWYKEHIYTEDYVSDIEQNFREKKFLLDSEKKKEVNIHSLALDAAQDFRYIFKNLKI